MKKLNNQLPTIALLTILLLIIAATGALGFTAPRFGPKLLEPQATVKIYAYQYPPLIDSRTPGMGLAADIAQSAFEEENIGVQIEILPIKSLAKRSVLYDKAVAMLGEPTLFSGSESTNLAAVTTCSMRGVNFSLIFNTKHPQAKKLKQAYLKGLEKIRRNGRYEKILNRYKEENHLQVSGTYVPAATGSVIEFGSSDTPPFYSPDLPDDGMAGEIVHAIFSEIGMKSRIHYFPLKRLQTDLQNNHLGDPDNFTGQRFSAIVPVAVYRSAFFYYKPRHRGGIDYKKPEDLNGYNIGMIRGTLENRGYFDKNAIRVTEANNEETLFRQLKEGRIDLCGVIGGTGRYTIRKLFPTESENFVAIEIPKSVRPVTIMIDGDHPNGAALGAKISDALKKIMKNGKYLHILEKHYGKENLPQDWFEDLEKFRSRYQQLRSFE